MLRCKSNAIIKHKCIIIRSVLEENIKAQISILLKILTCIITTSSITISRIITISTIPRPGISFPRKKYDFNIKQYYQLQYIISKKMRTNLKLKISGLNMLCQHEDHES
jgi:hypothetical protein